MDAALLPSRCHLAAPTVAHRHCSLRCQQWSAGTPRRSLGALPLCPIQLLNVNADFADAESVHVDVQSQLNCTKGACLMMDEAVEVVYV